MKIFDPDNDDKYKQLEKSELPTGYRLPENIDVEKELGSITFSKSSGPIMKIDTYDYDTLVTIRNVLERLTLKEVVQGEMEQMRDMLAHFIIKTTRDE